jgi:hypothetical protein
MSPFLFGKTLSDSVNQPKNKLDKVKRLFSFGLWKPAGKIKGILSAAYSL